MPFGLINYWMLTKKREMSHEINLNEERNRDLLELVKTDGELVSSKIRDDHIILLYSLDHFLIEMEYSMDFQKIERMRIVYDMDLLNDVSD
jgi:hypothetical protein